jgi:alpha-glucosidase
VTRGDRWWEGACIYQIYVRSFADTDGDGYGDLAGVTAHLDHVAWLGAEAIWLSPINPSPDTDWGYDVSNYRSVHPELGSTGDLDELVAEAGRRGIRILLDLVPNHTSDAHPWFVEARSGPDSARRDWYVWADPGAGGGPPNNWVDATGGSAWTLDPSSGQYYLHNFLPTQPDLNWWNDDVRSEFEEILRYWFDRGVAGFRIDVAHALFHDRQLRDNPEAADGPETRFGQRRSYSMNRPEVHEVYRDWRKIADDYTPPRLLLGETWVLDPERLAAFYGEDDELHLGFNFRMVFTELDAAAMAEVVDASMAALPPGSCPAWAGSNHDLSRFPTRWAAGDRNRARLALAVLCGLPGTVVLYYGDELLLEDVEVPPAVQRDPMTWRAHDGRFNRDRSRTPMPWTEGTNFGFCAEGVVPWLPFGERAGASVEAQRGDPDSALNLARGLLAMRRGAVAAGDYERLPSGPEQWLFRSGALVTAANMSASPARVVLPAGGAPISTLPGGDRTPPEGGETALAPWEAIVYRTDGGPGASGTKEE